MPKQARVGGALSLLPFALLKQQVESATTGAAVRVLLAERPCAMLAGGRVSSGVGLCLRTSCGASSERLISRATAQRPRSKAIHLLRPALVGRSAHALQRALRRAQRAADGESIPGDDRPVAAAASRLYAQRLILVRAAIRSPTPTAALASGPSRAPRGSVAPDVFSRSLDAVSLSSRRQATTTNSRASPAMPLHRCRLRGPLSQKSK
jgi:hypothetical protein